MSIVDFSELGLSEHFTLSCLARSCSSGQSTHSFQHGDRTSVWIAPVEELHSAGGWDMGKFMGMCSYSDPNINYVHLIFLSVVVMYTLWPYYLKVRSDTVG